MRKKGLALLLAVLLCLTSCGKKEEPAPGTGAGACTGGRPHSGSGAGACRPAESTR